VLWSAEIYSICVSSALPPSRTPGRFRVNCGPVHKSSLDFSGEKSPESAFNLVFFFVNENIKIFQFQNSSKFQLLISHRSQKVALLAPHPLASLGITSGYPAHNALVELPPPAQSFPLPTPVLYPVDPPPSHFPLRFFNPLIPPPVPLLYKALEKNDSLLCCCRRVFT